MTDSRETMRRKAYKAYQDRARPVDTPRPAVSLTELCVIRGCLCLKQGANLCPTHQNPDQPKANRCHKN